MSVNSCWLRLLKNSERGKWGFLSGGRWPSGTAGTLVPCRRHAAALSPAFLGVFFFAVLSLLTPICASTQEQSDVPFDVVLALDNSGSMKRNDPDRVMGPVVSAFAARLPQDTRLGIVVFDKTAGLALTLSSVSEPGFTEKIEHALERVNYRGQWTDIPGAVERSLYELREHGRPASHRVIVLFTDGFVDLGDPARNRSRGEWLRSDLTAEAKRESVMIFGIAFTEDADFELIQSVSQQTGGAHFRILKASEMADVFERLTDSIRQLRAEHTTQGGQVRSPGQRLPIAGDSGQGRSVPLLWLGIGLATLLVACGLWLWWVRSTAPAVPATLQDCGERAKIYSVDKRVFRIGRVRHKGLRRNDLVIPGKHVSRAHAEILFRNGNFYVKDDGSLHGTFVNGVKLNPRQIERLKNGDILRFDAYEFLFGAVAAVAVGGASVLTEPAPEPNYYQPPPGAPTLIGHPGAPTPVAGKAKFATVPPPGFEDGISAPLSAEEPSREVAKSSKLSEICLGCDKLVPSGQMRMCHGYRICGECEAAALTLQSGQVEGYIKSLETKRLRRLQTIGNL